MTDLEKKKEVDLDIESISDALFNSRMVDRISQLEMSKRASCSRTTFWQFENEPQKLNITVKNLKLIIDAYGFDCKLVLTKRDLK